MTNGPNAFEATGGTYLQVVGDPGVLHNVGQAFNLAAATESAALTNAGDTVFTDRISSVQDFATSLTSHGTITGGVTYFGHAFQWDTGTGSLLGPGQVSTDNARVHERNVHLLSNAQLGPSAVVTLKGCHAGLPPIHNERGHSIAQLIADQLERPVKAWRVGMFFTPNPAIRFSVDVKVVPPVVPIYMLPEGGQGVQPCIFQPHQPEPVKCGGVR